MATPKFRLTKENYYDPRKPHLSVSKIKDYFKDPAFYKRRHIDLDPAVQFRVTGPVKRGSIVDDLLTRGATEIQKRVLKKDDPALYERQQAMDERLLVEPRYYDEAMEIVEHLKAHPAWKNNLYRAEMQHVLEGVIDDMPVCGLADRVETLGGDRYRLIDLKVTSPIKQDSPRKWLYNVLEMGYDMQFALYQRLLAAQLNVPKTNIECAHIVASYVEPGLIKVGIYLIPQSMLDAAMPKLEWAIRQIKEKRFEPNLMTWDEAKVLPYAEDSDADTGFEEEEESEE